MPDQSPKTHDRTNVRLRQIKDSVEETAVRTPQQARAAAQQRRNTRMSHETVLELSPEQLAGTEIPLAFRGQHAQRSSWAITLAVWKALFLREAVTRISTSRAQWFWLLANPLTHIVFLMVLFATVRTRITPGVDQFPVFLAVGVLGFQMFRNVGFRSVVAIAANTGLFSYRQIKPVDTILVRAAMEGFIHLIVSVVLLAGSALLGFHVVPAHPLEAMTALTLLWLLGLGFGLILAVGAVMVPELENLAKIIFVPLYLISGVMYPLNLVPPKLRDWLMVNPIPHGIDALHAAFFPRYHVVQGTDVTYLLAWALVMIFLGLALHIYFERKLVAL